MSGVLKMHAMLYVAPQVVPYCQSRRDSTELVPELQSIVAMLEDELQDVIERGPGSGDHIVSALGARTSVPAS